MLDRLLIICSFFIIIYPVYSIDTDSLEFEISNTNNKRKKIDLLNILSNEYLNNNPDKVHERSRTAIELAEEIQYEKGLANAHRILGEYFNQKLEIDSALNHLSISLSILRSLTYDDMTAEVLHKIGIIFFNTSNYKAALQYSNEALELYQILEDRENLAAIHSLLCNIKSYMGFNESAIENCHISLNYYESLEMDHGKAALLNSMGNIYLDLGQFEKARQFFNQALYLAKRDNDRYVMAESLNNLGHMHMNQGDHEDARMFFQRALELDLQENDLKGIGYCYFNLSLVSHQLGEYNEALENLNKSLEYSMQSVDLELQAKVYSEIGILHAEMGNYDEGINYLKRSLSTAQRIDANPILQSCYNNLAKYYDLIGDQDNALIYFKLYMLHREEMFENQSALKIAEAEALYELENKEKQIQLLRSENRIKDLEAAERNLMNIWLITGLVFVITLTVVVFRQYRIQNKANRILFKQKEAINKQKEEIAFQRDDIEKTNYILADKNKQITDSIEYAKRIQLSLLPDKKVLGNFFSDSFIVYIPRDIVSGDFYWLKNREDVICFATVDCTGHGVPGAFMTVLANSMLNEISLNAKFCSNPNEILYLLDQKIKNALKQHEITLSAFEGMDLGLCIYHKQSRQLFFSGAKIPLYHFRNGELNQINGDRYSVGGNEVENKIFTQKQINLSKGDILYVATDGFQDQFGGNKGKKFMKLHFKNLLKTINELPLSSQEDRIKDVFYEWKGDYPQTDDVLILGVKA